jgi:hypothetical protein
MTTGSKWHDLWFYHRGEEALMRHGWSDEEKQTLLDTSNLCDLYIRQKMGTINSKVWEIERVCRSGAYKRVVGWVCECVFNPTHTQHTHTHTHISVRPDLMNCLLILCPLVLSWQEFRLDLLTIRSATIYSVWIHDPWFHLHIHCPHFSKKHTGLQNGHELTLQVLWYPRIGLRDRYNFCLKTDTVVSGH